MTEDKISFDLNEFKDFIDQLRLINRIHMDENGIIHDEWMDLNLISHTRDLITGEINNKEARYKLFLELLEEFGGDCPNFNDCTERVMENIEPIRDEARD